MKINNRSGLPLQIYIPNLQTLQPFEMEFYTNPTTAKEQNIVASFDGVSYSNCTQWEKGVYLYTDQKLPNTGKLLCRATYYVPSPMTATGIQKVVVDKLETGIELVAEGGTYLDPVADPSKLPIPSFNDPSCSHIPVFMTYYPAAEKGDKGDKGATGAQGAVGATGAKGEKGDTGAQGIQGEKGTDGNIGFDKSILAEQLIPGEFFVNLEGEKRQVYSRTFVGTIAKSTPSENRMGLSHNQLHTPIQVMGTVIQGQYNDPIIVPNNLFGIMNWGNFGISIYFDSSLIGKQFAIAVKYIKA